MGSLAALPGGARLVEAFGDMAAPASLRRAFTSFELVSPVGLGAGLDAELSGLRALSHFGVGFIEIGPVTRDAVRSGKLARHDADGTITYGEPLENPGLEAVTARLSVGRSAPARLAFRLAHARGAGVEQAAAEVRASLMELARHAAFFTLDLRAALDDGWPVDDCERHIEAVCQAARALPEPRPLVLCLPPDLESETMLRLAPAAMKHGAAGISVSGGFRFDLGSGSGQRCVVVGATTRQASLERVRALRQLLGPEPIVLGSGGVASPVDALALFDAGATLVQIHSGLVFVGPGLAKRINEALVAREQAGVEPALSPFSWRLRWGWGAIYGGALVFMALLVLVVAVSRVLLPYDELYLGMTRAGIDALDPQLIPFMRHDRVTAAGATMSIGLLYFGLSAFGIRTGERWASRAILISSVVGFASYWLWLRLGYFEPLHALAVVLLLPIFVAVMLTAISAQPRRRVDTNDASWRHSLVAQLLFVTIGVGFVIGGVTISIVGVTSIFVHSDMVFLNTTAAALDSANRRLLPLIAHDRAGFGGALAAYGVALTLTAMWGFRRGVAWLWWTLLVSGVPGFAATLAVHAAVGYTDFWHLAPVNFALILYAAGLVLARPYLCDPKSRNWGGEVFTCAPSRES